MVKSEREREREITDGMPIMLRNNPAPKYKAKASIIPIPDAKSKAVETEGSCILSGVSLSFSFCKTLSADDPNSDT